MSNLKPIRVEDVIVGDKIGYRGTDSTWTVVEVLPETASYLFIVLADWHSEPTPHENFSRGDFNKTIMVDWTNRAKLQFQKDLEDLLNE